MSRIGDFRLTIYDLRFTVYDSRFTKVIICFSWRGGGMIDPLNEPLPTMAYCGLMCGGCPIYRASREENADKQRQMRIEIARKCNEHYGVQYGPEDVTDCDGCKAQAGKSFQGCLKCEIRPCAQGRKLESCGYCDDFACERLEGVRRIIQ